MRRLPDTRQEPTIEHVAKAAGVSIRTVSRVLNQSPKVNADTRQRVQDAIDALHFRPSQRARALAMGRTFLLGLVHNDRNALVLDAVQRAIVAMTAARGYELIVHPTPADPQGAIADVLGFAERARVDGVIVMPPISTIEGLAHALEDAKLPAVAISSIPIEGFAGVIWSREREAGGQVADYLLHLGHRRLGIVNGPADGISAGERRAGFMEAVARDGRGDVVEAPGDYDFASGVAGAHNLLDLPQPPTAIFAANDIMGAGVLKAAAARGIAVPEQLSVVGFDGSLLTPMLTPSLTSMMRPVDIMAGAAANRLIDLIEGKEGAPVADPSFRLIVADSSGPAPD